MAVEGFFCLWKSPNFASTRKPDIATNVQGDSRSGIGNICQDYAIIVNRGTGQSGGEEDIHLCVFRPSLIIIISLSHVWELDAIMSFGLTSSSIWWAKNGVNLITIISSGHVWELDPDSRMNIMSFGLRGSSIWDKQKILNISIRLMRTSFNHIQVTCLPINTSEHEKHYMPPMFVQTVEFLMITKIVQGYGQETSTSISRTTQG